MSTARKSRTEEHDRSIGRFVGVGTPGVWKIEERELMVWNRKANFRVVGRVDLPNGIAARHELSDIDLLFSDAAIKGRAHVGACQINLRLL